MESISRSEWLIMLLESILISGTLFSFLGGGSYFLQNICQDLNGSGRVIILALGIQYGHYYVEELYPSNILLVKVRWSLVSNV